MNAISLKLSGKALAGALVLLAVAGCTPTEEKKDAGTAPQSALKRFCSAARCVWVTV